MQEMLSIQNEVTDGKVGKVVAEAASSERRFKVLVSAYACSPVRGSEYGVGWGWVNAIAKYHDLWVITGAECKDEIEAYLSQHPELSGKLHFSYVRRKRYLWAESIWPPAYLYTYKNQWQKDAYKVGEQLHRDVGFDIVHQLTYVGFRVPGWLWKLDAPFVWGPIGGLEQTRWALVPTIGLRGMLHFGGRNLLNDLDRRLSRTPKEAFAKADGGIIAATKGMQREIKRFYGRDSIVVSEIGLPPITRREPVPRASSQPLSLLWCGYLLPGKALPYLLEALGKLPDNLNWNLKIVGKGPCLAKWQRIAREQGVANRCQWLGQVPREVVLRSMHEAHALVITSVHDLTSTVLVEALANGLPVVCPDHCGFSDAITSECGIKVSPNSKKEIVTGIRKAILLLTDEAYRLRLVDGAILRSAEFGWDRKAQIVSGIYSEKSTRQKTVVNSNIQRVEATL